MESDIVTRLRGAATKDYGCLCPKCEAADEIERLRAELASMEKKRDRAIKQRDKANENLREACKLISRSHYRWTRKWPWEIAAERGWKCFKKGDGA